MNDANPIVTEADLHAYADGQLPDFVREIPQTGLSDD